MCSDVSQRDCIVFDMTYSDNDDAWTVATDDVYHVRTVEIILDSGADGSALPMEYASTGVAIDCVLLMRRDALWTFQALVWQQSILVIFH